MSARLYLRACTPLLARPTPHSRFLLLTPLRRLRSTGTSTDTVNPPPTSIPAPITLPVRTPDTSMIPHLFAVGKAYLSFFKTGMRNILTNYTSTRPVQALADTRGEGTLTALIHRNPPLINRSQFQHLLRARHDILRLPAFGVIFILAGELSPFLLPFVSPLVPYPCRVPAQLSRQRRKAVERRIAAFSSLLPPPVAEEVVGKELRELDARERAHVARVLGVWRWRLARRVEYLALDDVLLKRGGGVNAIHSGEELLMAAEERGIDTFGRSEEEVRGRLQDWEKLTNVVGGVRAGVWLLRPESWGRTVEEVKSLKTA